MDLYKIHGAPTSLKSKSQFSTQSYTHIASELIAPIDILQEARSDDQKFEIRNKVPISPTIMDKRHPSSFQQLDKVQRSGCNRQFLADYVYSLARAPMLQ